MTLVALPSLEKSWHISFRQSRTKVAGTVWAGSRVNVEKGRGFFFFSSKRGKIHDVQQ